MPTSDKEIVAMLAEKLDISISSKDVIYDNAGNLINLTLSDKGLSQVPSELGQLSNLQFLYLDNNQLTTVPPELGKLSSLQWLYLDHNQLSTVPTELGKFSSLDRLTVEDNPLRTLPIEIITQGTPTMLFFLRELEESGTTRYEAKLLVVGEGSTGKSSLLRALRNQSFEQGLSTTHGIEVDQFVFPHPQQPQTSITLNTWDFGGQQIYHATHQFFLTSRSIYLVTWNARLGVEQGRLHYWLETIKALAPNAPCLIGSYPYR